MKAINIKAPRVFTPLIVLSLFIFGGLFFWSCSGNNISQNGQQTTKILTIGTFSKAYGNAPYYIAKHFKWFEEDPNLKGFVITYKEFNDRPAISDAFSNGSLQVLFSGDAPAILTRGQGSDIKLVAISGNAAQEILVQSDLPINSVSDLRGKKLAVQQATSSHYALLKILNANNLKESDVNLIFMPAAEAKEAFGTKRIDAWAVWAPWVEEQQIPGSGKIVPGGNVLINSVMSVPSKFITEDEAAVKAVVSAIDKAKKWMVANPDKAQEIIAQELGYKPEVVKLAWGKFHWDATVNDEIITDLQNKADFLAASGQMRDGKTMNVRNEYVDLRFVPTQLK